MSNEYLLPDVGEGLVEAEIITWRVQVGDEVAINDIVVEIETAKSLVELPSPYAGTVEALLVPEGETVAVGTPIIRISGGVGDVPAPRAGDDVGALDDMDLSNPAASGGGEGESLVGRNKVERAPVRRARKGSASPATQAGANTQLQLNGAYANGRPFTGDVAATDEPVVPAVPARMVGSTQVLAKPPVRKLARDLGVDLSTCRATGPGGVITREDVESAGRGSETGAGRLPQPSGDGDREYREPIKGVRKMMGAAMVASAFTAPHVTEWITVDVTRSTEFVQRLRSRPEFRDVKVSPLLVLAAATLRAIRRTPVINSTWDESAQEVVFKRYVNLGIAAATPRGLVVPNVKDADRMSLRELAEALSDLTAVAREGRTQPADMAGGTFTITNVGVFGVDGGTPIINPGESAILCFGATKRQPWVVVDAEGRESVAIRDVCTLSLSFDHRHVDGESGSRFLTDVALMMEDPASALMF